MDCDFSHDPDEIPNFLKAAQNADLVLGSRYSGGVRVLNWPLKRLLLSRCAGIYVWLITGMPFTDPTGGYKCFRRRALQAINLDPVHSNGYSFQIEMTHRLWRDGFKSPKCRSPSPSASKASPSCRAASSPRRSGWSGGCGCKTACAAGRAKRRQISLTIHDIAFGGEGVGRVMNSSCSCRSSSSAKRRGEITEVKKNFARAKLLRVVTPSPERVAPECRYFGACGGCQYQHIDYAAQLRLKHKQIADLFERVGKISPEVAPVHPLPAPYGYRNRIMIRSQWNGRRKSWTSASSARTTGSWRTSRNAKSPSRR
jgi:hypothetical protein